MYIRMDQTGLAPEMTGGVPRIIEDASKVPMPDRRTLAEWTPAERATESWYGFVDNKPDERIWDFGEPAYSVDGFVVTRTFPAAALKDIETLRRLKHKEAHGHYRRNLSKMAHAGKVFDSGEERAGVVALQLLTTRQPGYQVLADDGTAVAMSDAAFRDYAAAMANHIEAVETRRLALVAEIDAATDPMDLLAINATTGW